MVKISCPATGCKYVVNGMNKEDVLRQMAEHRKYTHGRKEMAGNISPESGKHSVK